MNFKIIIPHTRAIHTAPAILGSGSMFALPLAALATGIVSLSLFPRSLSLTLESGRITLTVGDRDFSLTLPSTRI